MALKTYLQRRKGLKVKSKCEYKKAKKRVGRGNGSGHGKTSCRGQKGQMSRTGSGKKPGFEGGQMTLIRRMPKRGFNNTRFQDKIVIVNVDDLNRIDSEEITAKELIGAGLIDSRFDSIKVLGRGRLEKAVTVHADAFTKQAQEKIEKAGGKVVITK